MTELGEIPHEWEVNNGFIKIKSGFGFKLREYELEGIPLIRINNVMYGEIINEDLCYLPCSYLNNYKEFVLKKGDVLLALNRPITNNKLKIGKITEGPSILYQRVGKLEMDGNRYHSDFYFHYMQSESFINRLNNSLVGTDQPYIKTSEFENLKFVVPTLEEQEKIASILSTVDEQINNVEALIKKNKELKKGLMQTLLTKGIGHTKFKKTEIGEIPEGWSIKTINDVVNLIKSGLSRSLKDEDIGIPCIRSNNMNNYKFDKSDLKYWFLEDNKGANINEYILRDGDILVNFINSLAQIGKTCLYEDIGRPVIYTTNIFRMNLNEQIILNKYFYYISQTERYNNEIKLITKPAVNQASFTVADFKSIKISIPPINEQMGIVSILSEVDKKIEEHENKKQKLEEIKKGLMQQLLTGKIRVL